jgi:hypothetical protein
MKSKKTKQVDYAVLDDADDELEDTSNFLTYWMLEDIAHDIDITRATVDIFIDAQDQTDINSVMLALEGVSYRLNDVQTRLMQLVSGDE